MKVKIPTNPEKHLIMEFGKNWRIPDKNYNRGGGADFVRYKKDGVKICEI
jgi:hypothetical protein